MRLRFHSFQHSRYALAQNVQSPVLGQNSDELASFSTSEFSQTADREQAEVCTHTLSVVSEARMNIRKLQLSNLISALISLRRLHHNSGE